MMFRVCIALAVACLAVPSTVTAQSTDDAAIRAARERSNRGIAAHDTTAMAAEWSDDLIVMTSAGRRHVGRSSHLSSFAQQFAARPDVVYRRTPTRIAVHTAWAIADEAGVWEGSWTQSGTLIRVGGTYSAKWSKADGRWRISAELYHLERCAGEPYCSSPPPSR